MALALSDAARVSVCMATYNGELYVREQVDSILAELDGDDEIIIVDDGSRDGTLAILRAVDDARVRLFVRTENQGYVRTFEEAIRRSSGEFILLADQDDVWVRGRVHAMVDVLRKERVVASNMLLLGSGERPVWSMLPRQARQWRRNVLRILAGVSGYYGCGMGFRRDLMEVILPFPQFLTESHDLWIALAGNLCRSIGLVESPTLFRRLHATNVTPTRPRSLKKIIAARLMLLRSVISLQRRIRSRRVEWRYR
jgi:glycosyltransferase involved in cell wall biosynthesis